MLSGIHAIIAHNPDRVRKAARGDRVDGKREGLSEHLPAATAARLPRHCTARSVVTRANFSAAAATLHTSPPPGRVHLSRGPPGELCFSAPTALQIAQLTASEQARPAANTTRTVLFSDPIRAESTTHPASRPAPAPAPWLVARRSLLVGEEECRMSGSPRAHLRCLWTHRDNGGAVEMAQGRVKSLG
jgi:hypothetical protein